jgi:DNA-binding XRE family transcriptional regulator
MLKMMRFTVEFYESETVMTGKTNFDAYLNEQLRDPDFAKRFEQAGEAWEIAVQIAALREERGLSQRALAKLVGTSQQQISRLESPTYAGHSLSMLRRVADALGANVHVSLQAGTRPRPAVAESKASYTTGPT